MSAGIATLTELNSNYSIFDSLEAKGKFLAEKMTEIFARKKMPFTINQLGSMISIHFCKEAVTDFETASVGNNDTFKKIFHHMLSSGISLPPSAFETWFLSAALNENDLAATLKACEYFNKDL
jgi:glutamate-1-semialdehyde 2,1-aminomutase